MTSYNTTAFAFVLSLHAFYSLKALFVPSSVWSLPHIKLALTRVAIMAHEQLLPHLRYPLETFIVDISTRGPTSILATPPE